MWEFRILGSFITVLYRRKSQLKSVNEHYRALFYQQRKNIRSHPIDTVWCSWTHQARSVQSRKLVHMWLTSAANTDSRGIRVKIDTDNLCWTPFWTVPPIASKPCEKTVKCGDTVAAGCTGQCIYKRWRVWVYMIYLKLSFSESILLYSIMNNKVTYSWLNILICLHRLHNIGY